MRPRRRRHYLFKLQDVLQLMLSMLIGTARALQQQNMQSLLQSSNDQLLDIPKLKESIYSGQVYQHHNFLNENQVQLMLKEIQDMESQGKFERKGLSNTVLKNQTFTTTDRTICPVPWFYRALEGNDTRPVPHKIQQLQLSLSQALNRPNLMDINLSHECYFSKSEVGSRLPRHMDERHEELKGSKGWLQPSRRSLSWLIYLSDSNWDLATNGGALTIFPQFSNTAQPSPPVLWDSTHEENLQVGWLLPATKETNNNNSNNNSVHYARPVYLDSWFPVVGIVAEGTIPEPHCILYTIDQSGENKEYITRPWLNDSLHGMTSADFIKAWAEKDAISSSSTAQQEAASNSLFRPPTIAKQFTLLEDRQAWDSGMDPKGSKSSFIVPERGSLVVFDSVAVPHQVETIQQGTRVALAGWFHEPTQPFPESFYAAV